MLQANGPCLADGELRLMMVHIKCDGWLVHSVLAVYCTLPVGPAVFLADWEDLLLTLSPKSIVFRDLIFYNNKDKARQRAQQFYF